MEFLVLLGNHLHLTILWNLFFDISILLYGEMLKLAELSHFLADFGSLEEERNGKNTPHFLFDFAYTRIIYH